MRKGLRYYTVLLRKGAFHVVEVEFERVEEPAPHQRDELWIMRDVETGKKLQTRKRHLHISLEMAKLEAGRLTERFFGR